MCDKLSRDEKIPSYILNLTCYIKIWLPHMAALFLLLSHLERVPLKAKAGCKQRVMSMS